MVTHRYWTEAAAGTTPGSCRTRRSSLDPATIGAALRAGDLRGAQGLPPARRLGRHVPARAERRAASSARPRRLAMAELPEELFLDVARGARRAGPRLGADRRRAQSLYLRPFDVRHRGRSSACARRASTSSCSSPRPPAPYFPGGVKPVIGLALRRSTPAPRPAAPARPSAPATTPPRSSPRRRPPSRAATRSSGSTRSSTATSRRWAGMNLFFVYGPTARARHPGADRHAAARRHPRLAPHAGRATSGYDAEEGRISTDEWQAGLRRRRDHRGVRLRHGRGDHAGRRRSRHADGSFDGRRRRARRR